MKKLVILAAVLFLSVQSSSVHADLLTNGNFETGTVGPFGSTTITGWATWGTNGWLENDFNHTPAGSQSVKTWWDDTGIFQDFAATAGTQYNLSGFAYAKSTDAPVGWDGVLKVEWYNGATKLSENEIGRFFGGTDPTNTWKALSGTFAAPVSANDGRVVMYLTSNNGSGTKAGSIGWDDISANAAPVPEPASLLLLGSGLVGLFGFKKKMMK